MLEFRRERTFGRGYELLLDGASVGHWKPRDWRSGGRIEVGGEVLRPRGTWRARDFELRVGGGLLAQAHRHSLGRCTITYDGTVYELSRGSAFRGERVLLRDGKSLGSLRPKGLGKHFTVDLAADTPMPLQVFAGLIALTLWQRQRSASSSAAGASASG